MYRIIYKTPRNVQYGKQSKGNIMFEFEKQYKQFEELAERIKQVNEFWVNSVISSLKQLVKTK